MPGILTVDLEIGVQQVKFNFNLILGWKFDTFVINFSGEAACSPYRTWQTVYKHQPWHTMKLNKQQMKQVIQTFLLPSPSFIDFHDFLFSLLF